MVPGNNLAWVAIVACILLARYTLIPFVVATVRNALGWNVDVMTIVAGYALALLLLRLVFNGR